MKVSERSVRAQGPLDTRARKIPDPHDPCAVAVHDGQTLAGTVVEHDGSHFAFGPSGELIGEYRSRGEAIASLPFVDRGGESVQ